VRFVAKNAREYRGKWLSPATYRGWRDIGLLGYRMQPGEKQGKYQVGLPDTTCRVRNKERNRAYVDLAIHTGLRRSENTSLLVCELPPQQVDEPVEFWLPPAITKGGNGRMLLETPGAALAVHKYIIGERRDAIANARAAQRYESGDWLLIESVHRSAQHGLRVKWADGGRYASLDSVPPATRARLLIRTDDGVEPMALWLTERGVPMNGWAWNAVFKTANRRYADECRRVGVPLLSVSAHSLRFSYALMYLIALHRHIDKIEGYSFSDTYDYTRYHRAYRRVQVQLGHKDLTTTRQRYLEAIVDMRDDDLLLGAAGDLGATLVALAARTSLVRADADE